MDPRDLTVTWDHATMTAEEAYRNAHERAPIVGLKSMERLCITIINSPEMPMDAGRPEPRMQRIGGDREPAPTIQQAAQPEPAPAPDRSP